MDDFTGITWDTRDLYQGEDDPALMEDLEKARKTSLEFACSYKEKFSSGRVDAAILFSAFQDYEEILETAMVPYLYASLRHSADTRDEKRKGLRQEVRKALSEIRQVLVFVEQGLSALPEVFLAEMAEHKDLFEYKWFLLRALRWKPHALSEGEERILRMKDMTGKATLRSNFDELLASLTIRLEIGGKRKSLSPGQCLGLLSSPDRRLRERALGGFLKEIRKYGGIIASTLNSLVLDHHFVSHRRGFSSPMDGMHFVNDLEGEVVETMLEAAERHYPLAHRYFRLKRKLLGQEVLKDTDLFAPVMNREAEISFRKAARILQEVAEGLHPLFGSVVREMFEKDRIDAEPRRGKRYGAFCKGLVPSRPPYIALNYSGTIRDLLTLAHELGHSIHYSLSSKQSYLNYKAPPVLEETASTFFELAVTRFLAEEKEFEDSLPSIRASEIENIIHCVFRQTVLTRFEQTVHGLAKNRWLEKEEICRIWREENKRLFKDELEMLPIYHWGWAYIPHFFHNPFYCYSYVFGNLVSMRLIQDYRQRGTDFLEGVVRLLSSGRSRAPLELLEDIGLRPEDNNFWDRSFVYLQERIGSLEDDMGRQALSEA